MAITQAPKLGTRLRYLNWPIILVICMIASIGFIMLYSAAGGNLHPWASKQMLRFAVGLVIIIIVTMTDLELWLRQAYNLYLLALILLLIVEVAGTIGMGAQRWINLYVFHLQPSELMKIAMILALARYFHRVEPAQMRHLATLLPPIALVLVPALLVMHQPDLGTAVLLLLTGCSMIFLAGMRVWHILTIATAICSSLPVLWLTLHTYQKERILTFLSPERDPLGQGYHILQSKIALGSGGVWGKGIMQGSQSHLNFLPEKQTDFIFTMLCEETGLVGGVFTLALYGILIVYGYATCVNNRSNFGRFLAIGITTNLFLYVFINMGMVTGLVPVVGVPLPLMSYGGTSMLTISLALGLLMCADSNKTLRLR